MNSSLLTAREVAALTGVPVSTLHEWAHRRESGDLDAPGPAFLSLSPRHRRYERRAVETWLRQAKRG
ncbi:helix-turn-helix domain-containing protein [Tsukamurella sp. 8F]|uniref:helix-turn-helix transcriptional regulator n=1 Tax=unclassified Tsukamurella TaxID=2633480 RepID=UPI0023B9D805|nr:MULTISPECIES: helix-turn-helix domain-containing protein [unclassified Tsukamurella]MDF0529784.1 helix-turn-helix domain-containing protein [Tsukamurella sp. 8J]MDF0586976.1 helix-turn-helix domain-containing protein [Tsukamurella sp. 8F]